MTLTSMLIKCQKNLCKIIPTSIKQSQRLICVKVSALKMNYEMNMHLISSNTEFLHQSKTDLAG